MRLIHFLDEDIESDAFEDIKKKIHAECKPFLKQSKGYPLWRGMQQLDMGKFKVRKNRKPKDTPLKVHEEFDKIFKENFGWKARSEGLLTSGDRQVAGSYGTIFQVFPIGKFRFVWSKNVHDLYGRYVEFMTKQGITYGGAGAWKFIENAYQKRVTSDTIDLSQKQLESYQNIVFKELNDLIKKKYNSTNLVKAIESRNEIMIDCDEYYAYNSQRAKMLNIKKGIRQ